MSQPQLKNFAVSQGKNASKVYFAGQFTGQMTIGELLFLKIEVKVTTKNLSGQHLTPLPKFGEVTSLFVASSWCSFCVL